MFPRDLLMTVTEKATESTQHRRERAMTASSLYPSSDKYLNKFKVLKFFQNYIKLQA